MKINNRKKINSKIITAITLTVILISLIVFISIKHYQINLNKEKTTNTQKVEENIKEENTKQENTKQENIKPEEIIEENIIKEEINTNKNTNSTISNNEKENNIVKNEIEKENIKNPNNTRTFGNNVAFIGDSRTQAFLMYAGLKDVKDYTNIGLMVDTAITKKFITNDNGEKITILEDLKNKNIDTIYIMLGINELGWVYSSVFIKEYEKLIDKIQEIKPNCEIIVQSIIPVTKNKSDKDNTYNNGRIKEYNTLIKEMADRKNIKFIDLVPVLTDENGNLPEEASTDGIHLNKKYCLKWLECLKSN